MIKAVIFDMYETLVTLYEGFQYFGAQIAADAGIPEEKFLIPWRASDHDRTVGNISLEEVLESILKENGCYSEKITADIVQKRIRSREEALGRMNEEIIPMLKLLKSKGIKIGLISNCYSEEAAVIKSSILYPYFDTACLSCEVGIKKPDDGIFRLCLDRLGIAAKDCLYVGDGGSFELEAATKAGMFALQATWYLKEEDIRSSKRKSDFDQLKSPLNIVDYI